MRTDLTITCHADTPRERRGREQLLRLLGEYDLDRWLFTREVIIRSFVRPHSHPTLTLNTRQLDDDHGQLGTFLHEQFHWFAVGRLKQIEEAMAELRSAHPEVPVGLPEGANSKRSTYLHLIVCTLEFDALSLLLGRELAREVVLGRPYYRWVYRRAVEHRSGLRAVLERHGVSLPD